MRTFTLNFSSRETPLANGIEVYNSRNKLAVPNFLANAAINAGLGAAWTTADHWVGASVLTRAGHTGYAIHGQQFASPALIGLAAGPAYHWGKSLLLVAQPSLAEKPSSGFNNLLRTACGTVVNNGFAALVGVLVALAAQQRGDNNYPGIAHGAAISVTGNAILGAVMLGVTATIVGCTLLGITTAERRSDVEMGPISVLSRRT